VQVRAEAPAPEAADTRRERELVIDNILVRIHFIIVMIRWTGLAPWEFEFPFPGSLTSTFLAGVRGSTRFGSCRNTKPRATGYLLLLYYSQA